MRYKKATKRVDTIVSKTVCDVCKEPIGRRSCSDGNNNQITIESRLGDTFSEGDFRALAYIDCCPECWTTKVRPAIEALGVTFFECDAEDPLLGMPEDTSP